MMKKITLFLLLFISQIKAFSQCDSSTDNTPIYRGALAGLIFEVLYEDNTDVYDYEAASFPNPFIDLQEDIELYTKLKVLSYLRYDNGLTVYNYTNDLSACFKPNSSITKIEALIYCMEAWNIHPDYSGSSSPFNDISVSNPFYGYVHRAYDEGLIDGGGNFNPASTFTIAQTIELICEISDSSHHPVSEDLTDIDNYFVPGLYTPNLLAQSKGLKQGVFKHFAKNSFVIPDRKMSLNFSHFYSNSMVELPVGFFPIKPLSRGWSHTYNAYVIKESDVGADNTDYYYIVWPDGTIHIYNEDENEYESLGVYDDLDELSSGDVLRITKKNQTRYYFEQLDNDRDIWYLNEIKDPNGNEITIEYESAEEDDTRRIEYVEAPSGKRLEFQYLNNTDLIKKIEDPIERNLEFEYSGISSTWVFNYPVLTAFEDAKGNNTTYQYGTNNLYNKHLLKRIDLPRGNQITADYDSNGKLENYQINNDDPTIVDFDFDYQDNDFTSEVESPLPGGNTLTQNYTFNQHGQVTEYDSDTDDVTVSYPTSGVNVLLPDNTNTNGVKIEYEFDSRGNVTKIDKEDGDVVEEFEYDNDNNITKYTDPEGNVTEFFYDSDENLIEVKDAYNNSIYFSYDSYGQLLSQTNQEGITVNYTYESDGAVSTMTAPANISSSFTYDDINRLLERDSNGLISFYEYDKNDNVTSMTNSGGFTTTYDYDSNDNLVTITNAHGINTSFTYDDEDRPITETFGNLTKQYEYGDEGYLEEFTKPSGADIDYEYDNKGRLKETGTITDIDYNNRNLVEDVTNATGTISFRYDNLNLPEKITTVHGYDVEYDFEDTGLVKEITYPTINGVEFEVDYSYDKKNRIWQVILLDNQGHNGLVIAEYKYHDDDRIRYIDLANNTRINYSYDAAGRHRYIAHQELSSGPTLYIGIHQLDSRGNITESSEAFTQITNGNQTTPSSDIANGTYDNNNQALTYAGINHNVNDDGNTIGIGNDISLNFDIDDRLISYSDVDNTLSFKYNGYNQRVEATRNGVTTKYVRDVRLDNILVELDNSNNPIHYYIYSPNGMLLARMKPNGNLQYYHGDIRGSVVMMTDENADITHQYRYDDFGTIINYSEPTNDFNPYRYVGIYGVEHETDDLYYMRARYYKPSVGRFLTEDRIWSTNLYPYADNNPISKIDPSGNIPIETIADAVSIGVSATEFGLNPSWENAGYLAWDIGATLIPYVPGSYIRRVGLLSSKSSDIVQTFIISAKKSRQMKNRGWTNELIENTIQNPYTTRSATNKSTSNSATAYFRKDGSYIVRDDVTNEIVQISDINNPNWIPDNTIINPYTNN